MYPDQKFNDLSVFYHTKEKGTKSLKRFINEDFVAINVNYALKISIISQILKDVKQNVYLHKNPTLV
jgi:hypothetical protein